MTNIHRFFVLLFTLVVGFFGFGTAQAELPPVGAQLMGNLSIKTDYKPYNLSLPPGPWLVAFTKLMDADSTSGDGPAGSTTRAYKVFGEIGLVQVSNGILTGLILINTRLKTSIYVNNPLICHGQTIASHVNTFGRTGPLLTKCLEVKPFDWNSTSQVELMKGVKIFLNKLNINYPTDMIGLQFYEDDRRGRFLDFSYFVNPAVWGHPNTGSSVDRSPWGKSMVLRDPAKAALMQALTAYSEAYASVLSNSAREGGSGAGFVAFSPPPNGIQNMPSNSSAQSSDPRIKKISETCVTIGFKSNTPAMTNCIKELSTRN
jgi:hypothetical protein